MSMDGQLRYRRYQMAKKHCRKFQPAEYDARTLQKKNKQTDDRRTGDSIDYSERECEFTFAKKYESNKN